jgi:hypothetical protein
LGAAGKRENKLFFKKGFRLLSAYTTGDGVKVRSLTGAHRSSIVCVLLPSEY